MQQGKKCRCYVWSVLLKTADILLSHQKVNLSGP